MQEPKKRRWIPTGTIRKDALSELSGLVASQRSPGVLWAHNDSGDRSRFFAIHADGSFVAEIEVEDAANKDWEDIALDRESGTLYISDMGNNANKRDDLCVYKLREPEPKKATVMATKIRVAYPDQTEFPPKKTEWRFDCEAVFVYRKKLHLLTKHRAAGSPFFPSDSTVLYRLDSENTEKTNTLTRLDQRSGLGGWVTGADLSPDGKYLAVLAQLPVASVWIFETRGVGDKLLSKAVKRQVLESAKQCEAICFLDNQTLLLGNEQRELFRLPLADVTPV
ncbi:MAG: hypothetical protein NTX57_21045 [Armatimonadetes bacterium]|nr:hypothetical protein [Armatimonadota bacterium]